MQKFFLVFLVFTQLFAQNYTTYDSFSENEIASFRNDNDFEIVSARLHVNALGHFADGTYHLKSVDIEEIGDFIYKVNLTFVLKKRKYLSYSKNITFEILYKNRRFWIKYKGKIYKYLKPKEIMITKRKGNKTYQYSKVDDLHVRLKDLEFVVRFN